jgi:hypothetical protein
MDLPLYDYYLARSCPARKSSRQDAPYRCPADLQPAGDFGFAHAGAMQFLDFRSMYGCSCRPTQPFSVLPRVSKPRAGSFPQNLSFELGEDRQ